MTNEAVLPRRELLPAFNQGTVPGPLAVEVHSYAGDESEGPEKVFANDAVDHIYPAMKLHPALAPGYLNVRCNPAYVVHVP